MNTAKRLLALYVRDLLVQPEGSVVIVGRENVRREDYKALQIVIDSLVPATSLSRSNKYDGEAELMRYSQHWSASCTVDFYGDAAQSEATKFSLLSQSERALDVQATHAVTVLNAGGLIDVKLLTGSRYSSQLQLSVVVQYTESIQVPTLRIDEAQLEFNPS